MKSKIFLFGVFCILFSCSKENDPEKKVFPEITDEIKRLAYFSGNEKATLVIINAQGGPETELAEDFFEEILDFVDRSRVLLVNVHQGQTENPGTFLTEEISPDQAETFTRKTLENLEQVIEYFNEQDRTVYLMGASYGAYVLQEIIHRNGMNYADKFLIMVGRLHLEEAFVNALAEGRVPYYVNGDELNFLDVDDIEIINMGRLAVELLRNNYMERFQNLDLSKVTYIYGEEDEAVGRLSTQEIDFLNQKDATIIRSPLDHEDTLFDYMERGFEVAFGI